MQFSNQSLSDHTLQGLKKANYVEMTDIQEKSLPHSLQGKDILGAAKTGSGKTLAFLIPTLEVLNAAQWTSMDGLGVLIISPTRELALQTFQTLLKIGTFHSFSAGLLIGGKNLKQEQDRINRMNILVCTPGRLLQHMDQTPDFHCDNLQLLVLDEADRCLDCGFEKTLDAIIANLPRDRQTLLFSATQTKSVKDLARLSLKDPEYISVHEKQVHATPDQLIQKYLVTPIDKKLCLLYSFIKTHLKQKVIVFVSSCKQVRYIYETFCKLQPGIPLLCLHGKQKQPKRMAIFDSFCRKQSAVLFATDIVARGLDFPSVHWVLQVDCPEDAQTYIHRVGRTARYESIGNALLFLLPSEEQGMLSELEKFKIPIQRIQPNPAKTMDISNQLQSFCSQSPEIKYLAQKYFISYLRSIYLHKNKNIFKVQEIPTLELSTSLGLLNAPKISFKKKTKNVAYQQPADESMDSDVEKEKIPKSKIEKMFQKKNSTVLSKHYNDLKQDSEDEDEEDLLTLVRKNHDLGSEDTSVPSTETSHKQLLKEKRKELKKRGLGHKVFFDEEGNAVNAFELESVNEFMKKDLPTKTLEYLNEKSLQMKDADLKDKSREKQRLKELKIIRKLKEKAKKSDTSSSAVTLDPNPTSFSSDHDHESTSHYESNSYSDSEHEPMNPMNKKMKLDSQESFEALALQLLE